MADTTTSSVTQDDVRSLAEKLKQFRSSLSAGEQQALRVVVQRSARGRGQDVQGHYWTSPIWHEEWGLWIQEWIDSDDYYDSDTVYI